MKRELVLCRDSVKGCAGIMCFRWQNACQTWGIKWTRKSRIECKLGRSILSTSAEAQIITSITSRCSRCTLHHIHFGLHYWQYFSFYIISLCAGCSPSRCVTCRFGVPKLFTLFEVPDYGYLRGLTASG